MLPAILCLCFLTSACKHTPPEKRSNDPEIRQHITGTWTLDERPDINGYRGLEISPDGTLTSTKLDGTKQHVGTWKLDGSILVVTSNDPELVAKPDGSLGKQQYYPVIYASEHELICGLGISVAGRMRFKK